METNLTEGSIFKTLVRFSLPFLLSYFLQTLYGMADLYIIGQFCKVESTTAVSIGSQVMHMLTAVIIGLAMGSVVMIGRAVGALDKKSMARSIGNTVTLFMGIAIVLTVLLSLFVSPITSMVSTPEKAIPGTIAYLRICFIGIPFIVAYNVISSIFRGMGDSKSPMYFIAIACFANILLDYLFIGYFNLGPAGAALGTSLSQAISVGISLIKVRKEKETFSLTKEDFKPDYQAMKDILNIGLPVAFQDGFIQISFIIITVFVNLRGLEDAAAVGIVEKMICILFLVPSSMQQAVSTLAAQNIGARKHNRAKKTLQYACGITFVWGLIAVLIMHFYSESLIGLFTDDELTIKMGCQYMSTYVWDCVFAGIHFSFSGYFCAYGLSGISFMHNAISILLVRIPFSYLAAKNFLDTLLPMGLASTCGSILSVIICVCAYIYLKNKGKIQF